jgi:hypothetical protein
MRPTISILLTPLSSHLDLLGISPHARKLGYRRVLHELEGRPSPFLGAPDDGNDGLRGRRRNGMGEVEVEMVAWDWESEGGL